jgi:two-component system response regulator
MPHEEVEILLVEDSAEDVELTLLALQKNNLANKVHVARDGRAALDFLFGREGTGKSAFDKPPKFILLDLKLPKVDGLEVLRTVKGDARTKAVPVVVMTSSKEQRDMIEGYKLGVNSYIQKPIDFGQFRDVVKQLGYYWLVINQAPPPESFVP